MTILITGASGQLGRLVVDALLDRGVDPSTIVAGSRTPDALGEAVAQGVRTVPLDFTDRAQVDAALDGVDTVVLISGSEVGKRFAGHRNVIEAARDAGVVKLVYTSAPQATTFDYPLAPEHKATEEAIVASGVPAVILRNSWYTENYLGDLASAAQTGVVAASVGDARVASASRKDYAEAVAVVASEEGHVGEVYELGGDVAWTFDELAAAASDVLGREVVYVAQAPDERREALTAAGLDDGTVGFVLALEAAIADGLLAGQSGDLGRLIGRPTTPLIEGLRAAYVPA